MVKRVLQSLAVLAVLSGCGGNPFVVPDDTVDPNLPPELPGTENPGASKALTRYEALDEDNGNGFAEDFAYNATNDTYRVDNLGFDGANSYRRGRRVSQLGGYGVYEASATETDPQTGQPIPQFQHRMVAGISSTGRTEFALVRTGAYVGYGFGGFVIKRNDGVKLPTTGQAGYSGRYGGLRDFNGRPGLQYVEGNMTVAIDFEDFNDGDAVTGEVTNRQLYDMNGNNITASFLTALDDKFDPDDKVAPSTALPVLSFNVGPGVIDVNGEIRGNLGSRVVDYGGSTPNIVEYERGKYYAIVSGPNADELVGVIVVEAADPLNQSGTVRETGGFILYRP